MVRCTESLDSAHETIVICGVGAKIAGKGKWFEDEPVSTGSRWPDGYCGIKNQVGKISLQFIILIHIHN